MQEASKKEKEKAKKERAAAKKEKEQAKKEKGGKRKSGGSGGRSTKVRGGRASGPWPCRRDAGSPVRCIPAPWHVFALLQKAKKEEEDDEAEEEDAEGSEEEEEKLPAKKDRRANGGGRGKAAVRRAFLRPAATGRDQAALILAPLRACAWLLPCRRRRRSQSPSRRTPSPRRRRRQPLRYATPFGEPRLQAGVLPPAAPLAPGLRADRRLAPCCPPRAAAPAQVDAGELKAEVESVLAAMEAEGANLSEVTTKPILKKLEAKFGFSLKPRKQEVIATAKAYVEAWLEAHPAAQEAAEDAAPAAEQEPEPAEAEPEPAAELEPAAEADAAPEATTEAPPA